MKILSLTYEYPPIGGGGSVVAAAVNEELVRLGDEVTVLTSGMKGLPAEETVEGVAVHRTACVRRHRHYTSTAELLTTLLPTYRRGAQLIRAIKPDVIHAHFILPSGPVARALSERFDVPYVLTAHGSDVPGYNPDRFGLMHRMLKPAWRQIVEGASSVTSPSRFLAGLMRPQGCAVPISIVPNGHRPHPGLGTVRRNRVLVVARMFPRKGIQHFIDAVAGVESDGSSSSPVTAPSGTSSRHRRATSHRTCNSSASSIARPCGPCTSLRRSWCFHRSRKTSRWCCSRRWTQGAPLSRPTLRAAPRWSVTRVSSCPRATRRASVRRSTSSCMNLNSCVTSSARARARRQADLAQHRGTVPRAPAGGDLATVAHHHAHDRSAHRIDAASPALTDRSSLLDAMETCKDDRLTGRAHRAAGATPRWQTAGVD